jgi:hypothetical protein
MDTTQYLPIVYGAYALFSVVITVWLARILGANGLIFLRDVFDETPELAESVNRLLVVGFYLVNFGYACLLLKGGYAPDLVGGVEVLASKIGLLLLSLAFMHFMNLLIFHRIRRRARQKNMPPPIAPQLQVAPMAEAYVAYNNPAAASVRQPAR